MEPCRSGKPQGPDGRRFGVTAAVRSPTSMALAATRTLGRGFFHYLHAEVRRTLSKASKGKRIHCCACRHWRLDRFRCASEEQWRSISSRERIF